MMGDESEDLLLDACVAINLRATGIWPEIARASGFRFQIPEPAINEVLFVTGDDGEREPMPLRDLAQRGWFECCPLSSEELELMVSMAADLGVGEAACLAVGITRRSIVATDDRFARRRAQHRDRGLRLMTTAQLLRLWADESRQASGRVREALTAIEERASFRPAAGEPDSEWWYEAIT
jgi:predicted nucleic acid-binding protein